MQQLEATITIPPEFVLISKVEYEELLSKDTRGKFISLAALAQHLDCSQAFLKENILYDRRYKPELEKFIYYPQSQGEKWKIHQESMFKWLDQKNISIFLKKAGG